MKMDKTCFHTRIVRLQKFGSSYSCSLFKKENTSRSLEHIACVKCNNKEIIDTNHSKSLRAKNLELSSSDDSL